MLYVQHWSGPLIPTNPEEPWPTKRSFHAASCLFDPELVISYKDQICKRERG